MRPAPSFGVPTLLVALCTVAAGCGWIGSGGGSCAAIEPEIEAEPARAASAEPFELRGRGFADYSGRGGFLQDDCLRGLLPDRGIRVEFIQGNKTWELARLNSGENLTFEAELKVPVDAAPGEAVVRATSRSAGLTEALPPAEAPLRVMD